MSNDDFELDQRLAADCEHVYELPLCSLLLSKDANYPWLILVPRIADATEFIDLNDQQRQGYQKESLLVSHFLKRFFSPDKLNIAALGNVVSQLHVHHIARYKTDPAWPAPIWNAVPAKAYLQSEVERIIVGFTQYLHETKTGEQDDYFNH
jgi:diadenosine tetraphosphate (Ap4A) HIT family hydrolase